MGDAPLFVAAVHKTADVEETLPEGAHIKLDRACPVRLPQLAYTLAHEHERHASPLVVLHVIERTSDTVQERGKIQIVRDYGRCWCGKVFFIHLCAPFGRWMRADR